MSDVEIKVGLKSQQCSTCVYIDQPDITCELCSNDDDLFNYLIDRRQNKRKDIPIKLDQITKGNREI